MSPYRIQAKQEQPEPKVEKKKLSYKQLFMLSFVKVISFILLDVVTPHVYMLYLKDSR
jgi:hypothetical protein